jgi:hypothetical protein
MPIQNVSLVFDGVRRTDVHPIPQGGSFDVNENISLQENSLFRDRHTFKAGYEIMRTRHNVGGAAQLSSRYNMGSTEFPFIRTPGIRSPALSI